MLIKHFWSSGILPQILCDTSLPLGAKPGSSGFRLLEMNIPIGVKIRSIRRYQPPQYYLDESGFRRRVTLLGRQSVYIAVVSLYRCKEGETKLRLSYARDDELSLKGSN